MKETTLAHMAERNTPDLEADATPEPIRLDIGNGDMPREGWISVDRKQGREAYPLAYPDNYADEIEASHILEHFSHRDKVKVLRDWVRVLKPGGRIRIAVPDIEALCRMWLNGDLARLRKTYPQLDFERILYGAHVDDNDFHKSAYHRDELMMMMNAVGLIGVQRFQGRPDSSASYPFSLNMEGWKIPQTDLVERMKDDTIIVMSKPRLSWTENTNCLFATLHLLGIRTHTDTGAYVMEGMERTMTKYVREGVRYILTVDYDTVFRPDDVLMLRMLLDRNPQFDAIAPLQCKRGGTHWLIGHTMKPGDLLNDVVESPSAHFGLTLFRADRLADLPHPWMLPIPNEQGEWEEGRVDSDMRFWRHFKEHGRRLAISPRVTVGHLEVVVAWPHRLSPRTFYQQLDDYQDNGAPVETVG